MFYTCSLRPRQKKLAGFVTQFVEKMLKQFSNLSIEAPAVTSATSTATTISAATIAAATS
jgi:hypothetical protein